MSRQVWVVRAGRDAVYVKDFLSHGIAAIGWAAIGDLSAVTSRDRIAELLAEHFPEYTKYQLSTNTGQIFRFRQELTQGESVLTYDPGERIYRIGKITGDYAYRPDLDPELRHTRPVEWYGEIPRDVLSAATKNSLGSISTIFCVSESAADEIRSLIDSPLMVASPADVALAEPEPELKSSEAEVEVLQDTEQSAFEFMQDRMYKLSWEQMQELVAGLLRAMGYKARVSPFGPDRGRDIVASPDGFGFESPRIIVEVKHRKGSMGAPEVRAFAGGLRHADKGLYVSTGGFTREAKYESDRATYPLTLIDANDLAKAIIENYDQMDLETRTILPMKKIYWPV